MDSEARERAAGGAAAQDSPDSARTTALAAHLPASPSSLPSCPGQSHSRLSVFAPSVKQPFLVAAAAVRLVLWLDGSYRGRGPPPPACLARSSRAGAALSTVTVSHALSGRMTSHCPRASWHGGTRNAGPAAPSLFSGLRTSVSSTRTF